MRSSRTFRKGISLSLCVVMMITQIYTQPALAAVPQNVLPNVSAISAIDPFKIRLPAAIGKIEDAYSDSEGQTVILIQDAHAIPDAQKNIQKLIAFFQEEYGIDHVAVEGASGSLEPQIFKSFPEAQKLKSVFKDYLHRGELTGASAAAIFNPLSAHFEGVENWSLYENGYSAYLSAMAARPKIMARLETWNDRLRDRKAKLYSPELLRIDQSLSDFLEDKGDLTSTLQTLADVLPPEPESEIALMLSESRRRGDDAAVTAEVRWIAGKIRLASQKSKIPGAAIKEFESKFQAFQTDQLDAQAYALYLKRFISANEPLRRMIASLNPAISDKLTRFSGTARRLEAIEGTRFFKDFLDYAKRVKTSLITTAEQRAVDHESECLVLLKRYAELKLDQDDWEEIEKLEESAPANFMRRMFVLFKDHRAFYENAKKRDDVMFENILQIFKLKKSRIEKSDESQRFQRGRSSSVKARGGDQSPSRPDALLLIAGGFHTHGITKLLKKNGVSYAVIMPAMAHVPEKTSYESQMLGHVSWSRYFKVENGRIDLNAAFIRGTRDRLLKSEEGNAFSSNLKLRNSDPRLLKNWRDQIIRDLSEQGRIDQSGNYTRYIDELVKPEHQDPFKRQWIENIKKFVGGMRDLDERGQLNPTRVGQLLKTFSALGQPAGYSALVPGAKVRIDLERGSFVPSLSAKSEVRSLTSSGSRRKVSHLNVRLSFGDMSPAVKLKKNTRYIVSIPAHKGVFDGIDLFEAVLHDETRGIVELKPIIDHKKPAADAKPIYLEAGQSYKVGRHGANDLVTPAKEGHVSRFHGVLTVHAGGWLVYRDAGSVYSSKLVVENYADLLAQETEESPADAGAEDLRGDVSQMPLDVSMISQASMNNANESMIFRFKDDGSADWKKAVLELHKLLNRFSELKTLRERGEIEEDVLGQVDYLFAYGHVLIDDKLFGNPAQPYYYEKHRDRPNQAAIRLSKAALLVVEELEQRRSAQKIELRDSKPVSFAVLPKKDGLTDLETLLVSKNIPKGEALLEETRKYIEAHLEGDERKFALTNYNRPDLYPYIERARQRNVVLVFPLEMPVGENAAAYMEKFVGMLERIPLALTWQLQRPIYFAVLKTEGYVLGEQGLHHSLALGGADYSKFQYNIPGITLEHTIIHELVGHQVAVNGKRRVFNIQGNRVEELSNLDAAWNPLISRAGWRAIGEDNGLTTLIPLTPELKQAIENDWTIGGFDRVKMDNLPRNKTELRNLLRNLLNLRVLYYQNILELVAFTTEGDNLKLPKEDGEVRNRSHNYKRTSDVLLVTNSRIDVPVDTDHEVYVSYPYNRDTKTFDTVYVQRTFSGKDTAWLVVERQGQQAWQRTGKVIMIKGDSARSEMRVGAGRIHALSERLLAQIRSKSPVLIKDMDVDSDVINLVKDSSGEFVVEQNALSAVRPEVVPGRKSWQQILGQMTEDETYEPNEAGNATIKGTLGAGVDNLDSLARHFLKVTLARQFAQDEIEAGYSRAEIKQAVSPVLRQLSDENRLMSAILLSFKRKDRLDAALDILRHSEQSFLIEPKLEEAYQKIRELSYTAFAHTRQILKQALSTSSSQADRILAEHYFGSDFGSVMNQLKLAKTTRAYFSQDPQALTGRSEVRAGTALVEKRPAVLPATARRSERVSEKGKPRAKETPPLFDWVLPGNEVVGVFSGGGAKGVAYAGAFRGLKTKKIWFREVVGTSAGAIVAGLVAAGFTPEELEEIIMNTDMMKYVRDRSGEKLAAFLNGVISTKLNLKGRTPTFDDLPIRLTVIGTDTRNEEMLTFSAENPHGLSVGHAIRVSMGLPIIFDAYHWTDSNGQRRSGVDGGLNSNFPLGVASRIAAKTPEVQVLGFQFDTETPLKASAYLRYLWQGRLKVLIHSFSVLPSSVLAMRLAPKFMLGLSLVSFPALVLAFSVVGFLLFGTPGFRVLRQIINSSLRVADSESIGTYPQAHRIRLATPIKTTDFKISADLKKALADEAEQNVIRELPMNEHGRLKPVDGLGYRTLVKIAGHRGQYDEELKQYLNSRSSLVKGVISIQSEKDIQAFTGVLEAMQRERVWFDEVTGLDPGGAYVSFLIALGALPEEIADILSKQSFRRIYGSSSDGVIGSLKAWLFGYQISRKAVLRNLQDDLMKDLPERLKNKVDAQGRDIPLGQRTFGSLPIRLILPVVDAEHSQVLHLNSASLTYQDLNLLDAIYAGLAKPFVSQPAHIDSRKPSIIGGGSYRDFYTHVATKADYGDLDSGQKILAVSIDRRSLPAWWERLIVVRFYRAIFRSITRGRENAARIELEEARNVMMIIPFLRKNSDPEKIKTITRLRTLQQMQQSKKITLSEDAARSAARSEVRSKPAGVDRSDDLLRKNIFQGLKETKVLSRDAELEPLAVTGKVLNRVVLPGEEADVQETLASLGLRGNAVYVFKTEDDQNAFQQKLWESSIYSGDLGTLVMPIQQSLSKYPRFVQNLLSPEKKRTLYYVVLVKEFTLPFAIDAEGNVPSRPMPESVRSKDPYVITGNVDAAVWQEILSRFENYSAFYTQPADLKEEFRIVAEKIALKIQKLIAADSRIHEEDRGFWLKRFFDNQSVGLADAREHLRYLKTLNGYMDDVLSLFDKGEETQALAAINSFWRESSAIAAGLSYGTDDNESPVVRTRQFLEQIRALWLDAGLKSGGRDALSRDASPFLSLVINFFEYALKNERLRYTFNRKDIILTSRVWAAIQSLLEARNLAFNGKVYRRGAIRLSSGAIQDDFAEGKNLIFQLELLNEQGEAAQKLLVKHGAARPVYDEIFQEVARLLELPSYDVGRYKAFSETLQLIEFVPNDIVAATTVSPLNSKDTALYTAGLPLALQGSVTDQRTRFEKLGGLLAVEYLLGAQDSKMKHFLLSKEDQNFFKIDSEYLFQYSAKDESYKPKSLHPDSDLWQFLDVLRQAPHGNELVEAIQRGFNQILARTSDPAVQADLLALIAEKFADAGLSMDLQPVAKAFAERGRENFDSVRTSYRRSEVRSAQTQHVSDLKPQGVSQDLWDILIHPPAFSKDGRLINPLTAALKSGRGESLTDEDKAYLVGRFIEAVKKHAMFARGEGENRKYEWASQTSSAAYMRHPSEDPDEDLIRAAARRGFFSKNTLAFLEFWVEVTHSGNVPLTQAEIQSKALELQKRGALNVSAESAKNLLTAIFGEFETRKFGGVHVRGVEDQQVTGVQELKPDLWKSAALRALTIINLYGVYRFRSSLLYGVIGAFVLQFWGWFGFGGVILIAVKFVFDLATGNWLRNKFYQFIQVTRLDFFAQKEKSRILIRNLIYDYITEELEPKYISVQRGQESEVISTQKAKARRNNPSYEITQRTFRDDKKEYLSRINAMSQKFTDMANDPALSESEREQIKNAATQIRLLGDMALQAFQTRYWYPNAGRKSVRKILKTVEIAERILEGEKGRSSPGAQLWAVTSFFMADIGNSSQAPPSFFDNYQRPLWMFSTSDQRVFQQVLGLARGVSEKVQYRKTLEDYVKEAYQREVPGSSLYESTLSKEELEKRIASLSLADLAEINDRHYQRFQQFYLDEAQALAEKIVSPSAAAWNDLALRMDKQLDAVKRSITLWSRIKRFFYNKIKAFSLKRAATAHERLMADPMGKDKVNAVLRGLLIGSVYINQDRLDDLYQKAKSENNRANDAYILTTLHRSVLWKRFLADLVIHHRQKIRAYGIKSADIRRLLKSMDDKSEQVIRQHVIWALRSVDQAALKDSLGVDFNDATVSSAEKEFLEFVINEGRQQLRVMEGPDVMLSAGKLLLNKPMIREMFLAYLIKKFKDGTEAAQEALLLNLKSRLMPNDIKEILPEVDARHSESTVVPSAQGELFRNKKPENVSWNDWDPIIHPPLFKEADGRMVNPLIAPLKSGRGNLEDYEKAYLVGRFIESVKRHAMLARGKGDSRKYEWASQTSSAAYMRDPSEDSTEDLMKVAVRRGYFKSLAFLEFLAEVTHTGSEPLTQAEIQERAARMNLLAVSPEAARQLLASIFAEWESGKFQGVRVRVIENQSVVEVRNLQPDRWKSFGLRVLALVNLYLVFRFRSVLLYGGVSVFFLKFGAWWGLGGVLLVAAKVVFDMLTSNWLRTKLWELLQRAKLDFFAQQEKNRILARALVYNFITEEHEPRAKNFSEEEKEYHRSINELRDEFELLAMKPELSDAEREQLRDASNQIRLLGDMALQAFQARYWYPNGGKRSMRKILKTAEIARSIFEGEKKGGSSPAAILWALTAFFMADIGNSPQASPRFLENYQRPLWMFATKNQRLFQQVLGFARGVSEKVQYKKIQDDYVTRAYQRDLAKSILELQIKNESPDISAEELERRMSAVTTEELSSVIQTLSDEEKIIPQEQLEERVAALTLSELAAINAQHYDRFQQFYLEEAESIAKKTISPSLAAWSDLTVRMEKQMQSLERRFDALSAIKRWFYRWVKSFSSKMAERAHKRLMADSNLRKKINSVLQGLLIGSVYINRDRLDDLYQKAKARDGRANNAYILTTLHRSVLWKRFLGNLVVHHRRQFRQFGLKPQNVDRLLREMNEKTEKVVQEHLSWSLDDVTLDSLVSKNNPIKKFFDQDALRLNKEQFIRLVIENERRELKAAKDATVMIAAGELLLNKKAIRKMFIDYIFNKISRGADKAKTALDSSVQGRIGRRLAAQAAAARSEIRRFGEEESLMQRLDTTDGVEGLIEKIQNKKMAASGNGYRADEILAFRKAAELAEYAHKDQTRFSGKPYSKHLADAVERYIDLYGAPSIETLIVILFHDLREDQYASYSDTLKRLGDEGLLGKDRMDRIKRGIIVLSEPSKADLEHYGILGENSFDLYLAWMLEPTKDPRLSDGGLDAEKISTEELRDLQRIKMADVLANAGDMTETFDDFDRSTHALKADKTFPSGYLKKIETKAIPNLIEASGVLDYEDRIRFYSALKTILAKEIERTEKSKSNIPPQGVQSMRDLLALTQKMLEKPSDHVLDDDERRQESSDTRITASASDSSVIIAPTVKTKNELRRILDQHKSLVNEMKTRGFSDGQILEMVSSSTSYVANFGFSDSQAAEQLKVIGVLLTARLRKRIQAIREGRSNDRVIRIATEGIGQVAQEVREMMQTGVAPLAQDLPTQIYKTLLEEGEDPAQWQIKLLSADLDETVLLQAGEKLFPLIRKTLRDDFNFLDVEFKAIKANFWDQEALLKEKLSFMGAPGVDLFLNRNASYLQVGAPGLLQMPTPEKIDQSGFYLRSALTVEGMLRVFVSEGTIISVEPVEFRGQSYLEFKQPTFYVPGTQAVILKSSEQNLAFPLRLKDRRLGLLIGRDSVPFALDTLKLGADQSMAQPQVLVVTPGEMAAAEAELVKLSKTGRTSSGRNRRPSVAGRSEVRVENFNELFRDYILGPLLKGQEQKHGREIDEITISYRENIPNPNKKDNERGDYLIIRYLSDEKAIETELVRFDQIEAFYYLRYLFSLDPAIKPPLDPATIGEAGVGHLFTEYRSGEDMDLPRGEIENEITEAEAEEMLERMMRNRGLRSKFYEIRAYAQQDPDYPQTREVFHITKLDLENRENFNLKRTRYHWGTLLERHFELSDLLGELAEQGLLISKSESLFLPKSEQMLANTKMVIREQRKDWQGKLEVLSETGWAQFLRDSLREALGYLGTGRAYLHSPPASQGKSDPGMDARVALLTQNMKVFIQFMAQRSEIDKDLISQVLITSMKVPIVSDTPAVDFYESVIRFVFEELGTRPGDSDVLKGWHQKLEHQKFYILFKARIAQVKAARSEVRAGKEVPVKVLWGTAPKIFQYGDDFLTVEDGYDWGKSFEPGSQIPVTFHGTSSAFLDQILQKGLSPDLNPMASEDDFKMREWGDMYGVSSQHKKYDYISLSLNLKTAEHHAQKGPEGIGRLLDQLKAWTENGGRGFGVDGADLAEMKSMLRKYEALLKDAKPIIVVTRSAFKANQVVSADGSEYFENPEFVAQLKAATKRKTAVMTASRTQSDPLINFKTLAKNFPGVSDDKLAEMFVRDGNYAVHPEKVDPSEIIAIIQIEEAGALKRSEVRQQAAAPEVVVTAIDPAVRQDVVSKTAQFLEPGTYLFRSSPMTDRDAAILIELLHQDSAELEADLIGQMDSIQVRRLKRFQMVLAAARSRIKQGYVVALQVPEGLDESIMKNYMRGYLRVLSGSVKELLTSGVRGDMQDNVRKEGISSRSLQRLDQEPIFITEGVDEPLVPLAALDVNAAKKAHKIFSSVVVDLLNALNKDSSLRDQLNDAGMAEALGELIATIQLLMADIESTSALQDIGDPLQRAAALKKELLKALFLSQDSVRQLFNQDAQNEFLEINIAGVLRKIINEIATREEVRQAA